MNIRVPLVFCLPGSMGSTRHWLNLHNIFIGLIKKGISYGIASAEGNNIYGVRNACIGRKRSRKHQKPFEGEYEDYQKMIWVDSDNIITPDAVSKLLRHDVDIVGGWYRQYSMGEINDQNKAACGMWGRPFLMGEIPKMECNEKGLIPVDYQGLGLTIIRKGVLESWDYPWFKPGVKEWTENGEEMAEIITDDESFALQAKEHGFQMFIDPEVKIIHERKACL